MNKRYIFYTKDESFDYNSPMGTLTFGQYSEHGFKINIDKNTGSNDNLSIKGFGDFREMDNICNLDELEMYLVCNLEVAEKQYRGELEKLIEEIKEKKINMEYQK